MNNFTPISDEYKHSAAHILAAAVQQVFPTSKIGIGPVTKDGFYYDFDLPKELKEKDYKKIEEAAMNIVKEELSFQQIILPKEESLNLMLQRGQIYKAELIKAIPDSEISFFKTGEIFIDVCRGPHVNNTKEIGPIKIQKVEKVHWNDDESRPELTRIHGAVFRNEQEVEQFIQYEEETKNLSYKIGLKKAQHGYFENNKIFLNESGSLALKRLNSIISRVFRTPHAKEIVFNNSYNDSNEVSTYFNNLVSTINLKKGESSITFVSNVNLKDSEIKEERVESNVLITKRYFKEGEFILNMELVSEILDALSNKTSEYSAEVMFHDISHKAVSSISTFLQKNLISHTKVQKTQANLIKLNIKLSDRLGRNWDIVQINLDIETGTMVKVNNELVKFLSIEFIVNSMNLYTYLLENAESIDSVKNFGQPAAILPINKKFDQYSNETKEKLLNMGIQSKILSSNRSIKSRIYKAEKAKFPLIIVLGQKETDNNLISLRHEGRDIGMLKHDEVLEYFDRHKIDLKFV